VKHKIHTVSKKLQLTSGAWCWDGYVLLFGCCIAFQHLDSSADTMSLRVYATIMGGVQLAYSMYRFFFLLVFVHHTTEFINNCLNNQTFLNETVRQHLQVTCKYKCKNWTKMYRVNRGQTIMVENPLNIVRSRSRKRIKNFWDIFIDRLFIWGLNVFFQF